MNYFKGSGACGLSAFPLCKNRDSSVTKEVLNKYEQTNLDNVKSSTKITKKQRDIIFTD